MTTNLTKLLKKSKMGTNGGKPLKERFGTKHDTIFTTMILTGTSTLREGKGLSSDPGVPEILRAVRGDGYDIRKAKTSGIS